MAVRHAKGDLRALGAQEETTFGTGDGDPIYAGTLDTLTPSDSEEVTEVVAEGSRGIGTQYRTAASFGFTAAFKHMKESSTRGNTGWEQWVYRALGALSTSTTHTGANSQPQPFSATFKTSSTEQHLYQGCVLNEYRISATE